MNKNLKRVVQGFTERRILVTLLLGFSSGLPLALSSSTLQTWYTVSGISLKDIGYVGLAGLPYTCKFLWAPLMDRWVIPVLGRRRGWILGCQGALSLVFASMAFLSPTDSPTLLFWLAVLVAFLAASQDIAFDAYRTEMLHPTERPLGAAMSVNGYRIAMLVSGGGALIIAHHWGWQNAYLAMAFLMVLGTLPTFLGPEPDVSVKPPPCLRDCIVLPFLDFLKRPHAIAILGFIVLYKLGDAFAGALSQSFLILKINMNLTEIGTMAKTAGFLGTIFGTTAGALWMAKLGWFRSLLWFGILQALSNLFYMVLLWTGPNYFITGFAIFIENVCGGMGTAAFLGLLMGLCNARFTAFQFSLLSSLSAIGRVWIGPVAGLIAHHYGWIPYFLASIAFSIPGLILLLLFKDSLEKMMSTQAIERKKMHS